ncbi:hypothetical protein T260_04715 [Geobacillus thermopakistaniensis]|uniref:DUF624 domain-containing protein n=1 Tax=Geobacillus thermopakistaniensis (strain MAS1) TaxID=1408282 RepID=A0A7U9JCI8_GEOTM|nr:MULTISPECIES: YesL family protein [Geobacillus]ESU73067.1 hypothetical protein T260_04715 [Geobacillus sp. MAS1]WMJ18526.1 YesL family protein [Geobacillus kaustophilus]
MRSGLLDSKLYRVCEWITRLAYINIIWVGFTIIGLGILGVAPSTVALFTIVRKWLLFRDEGVPVFKTFARTYKQEFWRANGIGFLFMAIAYILYIDVLYIDHVPAPWQLPFSVVLFVIMIFYGVTLLYVFPIYVHYELRFWQYVKYAFVIGIANPFMTLAMIVSIGILLVVLLYVPGLIPFFSVSLFAMIVMGSALRVFRKVEERQTAWQHGR